MFTKKRVLIFVGFILLVSAACAAESKRLVTFDAGLSTGIPVYGDSLLRSENALLTDGGKHAIIGTVCDINFRLSDGITFFVGNDNVFDFIWNKSVNEGKTAYFHHIDSAFFPGLKIYPGLGGFNISCGYSVGTRWDFHSKVTQSGAPEETPGSEEEISSEDPVITPNLVKSVIASDGTTEIDSALWGNGFRIGLEYDFSYKSEQNLPSVGLYYRFCPRGNYHWDNVFALYCVMNF